MTILFLTLLIVGTVIAFPLDYPMKSTENPFVNIILESMNNNSPNNHSYRSGALLNARKISTENDPPVVNVSILLELNCNEEPCPREICSMLITQDESINLIVDDRSKECHDVKNVTIIKRIDERSKRETTEVDVKDPIIKRFMNLGTEDHYNQYKNAGKPFATRMVNATKEDIPDGTKYVIYFNIVEPSCIKSACFFDDFSPTRLCVINVENKDKVTTTSSKITSTCEKEPTPSVYSENESLFV